MLYVVESDKTVAEVAAAFPEAVARNEFGVLGVHDLKQKMKDKGVEFDRECLVFEACNPRKAKAVLEQNMDVSTALPCRVSVYSEAGKTKIAMIKPTALLAMFFAAGLSGVAQEVEDSLVKIITESK